MIKFFIPSLILGVFLYMTFDVEQYEDRLANLGFCLLAYISILENMRTHIPVLSILTFGEKFVITYMVSSLIPVFDRMIGFAGVGHNPQSGEDQ